MTYAADVATCFRQPIEGRVYLADGHPMLIEFDSAATVAEVSRLIFFNSIYQIIVKLDLSGLLHLYLPMSVTITCSLVVKT